MREAALCPKAAPEPQLARGSYDADCDVGQGGHVELVGERRAQTDDLLDRVRHSRREHLCQHATAAVADKAHASIRLSAHGRQPFAEPGDEVLGVVDVEVDARHVRRVADALQPVAHDQHRPVARQKTGDEEHRAAVPVRDAAASKDRIPGQRRELADAHGVPQPHSPRC